MDRSKIPGPGRIAPDFTCRNHRNETVSLHEILNLGKTVCLVFYRGHW